MTILFRTGLFCSALLTGLSLSGCAQTSVCKNTSACPPACDGLTADCCEAGIGPRSRSGIAHKKTASGCRTSLGQRTSNAWGNCKHACSACGWKLCGCWFKKSNAVPETLPLGSTIRSFDQVMQTNAEAADFVIHRHDFETQTARLTPDGRDKLMEIASRMSSTPFPVVIERSENNSDPELDALRRDLIARILFDLGHGDAPQRTVVAPAYGPGYTGQRAEWTYYQHDGIGNNNNNNVGSNGNFGGGTLSGSGSGSFGNF